MMKLSTRPRVVKGNAVEVSIPRLVECQNGGFQFLGEYLTVVRDTSLSLSEEENRDFINLKREALHEPRSGVRDWETDVSTVLNQAKAQAEEIIAQAQEILTKAQVEAQNFEADARQKIEDLRIRVQEEVSRQAYKEGYAEGLAQGLNEGTQKGKEEAEEIKKEAKDLLHLAQRAVDVEFSKVDETLLRLALKVSERIVRVNLKHHPDYLLHRIRALTLLPQEREGWRLHVSQHDAQWLRNLPPKEKLTIPLIEDDTLKPGDCYLECLEGIFDARLEAQLERFEHLLREELRHGGLEQAGR
jgi:flagellar assembly protein FliH